MRFLEVGAYTTVGILFISFVLMPFCRGGETKLVGLYYWEGCMTTKQNKSKQTNKKDNKLKWGLGRLPHSWSLHLHSLPPSSRYGMSHVYFIQEKYRFAEVCARRALAINSSSSIAYTQLALVSQISTGESLQCWLHHSDTRVISAKICTWSEIAIVDIGSDCHEC